MAEGPANRYKVGRLIEQYDLEDIGTELEKRWTREEDRQSLRDLATFFNRRLLRAALDSEDVDPMIGEFDTIFRGLQGAEDMSRGEREQVRTQLEQQGIDVEELTSDFITYQAMRTYLREARGAEPPADTQDPQEHRTAKRGVVQRLASRLTDVTEASLNELTNADHLTLGDFEVIVTVRVYCTECETRTTVTDLLATRGCQCDTETD